MTDLLLRFTVSNLCITSALALVAYAVHRAGRAPQLAHLLWVLVLVKLVTPPLVNVPLIPVAPSASSSATRVAALVADDDGAAVAADAAAALGGTALDAAPFAGDPGRRVALSALNDARTDPAPATPDLAPAGPAVREALVALWVLGSLVALVVSLTRAARFHRLLGRASRAAPESARRLIADVAAELGLRRVPELVATTARISPFVWWVGGRVRVVLPADVLEGFAPAELRLVLAHELAHVRRRDHWVRWVEWLACTVFWWNPIVWIARRNLRINEELGCDALVLESLGADRRRYATSLLDVAEYLSTSALRPPALASAMNRGGQLEERLTMILTRTLPRTPRWLQATVLSLAAGLLPVSLAYAQDVEAVERRLGAAVAAGELTLEQAQLMLEALRRSVDEPAARSRTEHERAVARMKERIEAGEVTHKEALEQLEALEREREARSDRDAEARDGAEARQRRIAVALAEGGVPRESLRDVMGAMDRIQHELRAEGDSFELDPGVREWLTGQGLDARQIDVVVGLSRRIAAATERDEEVRATAKAEGIRRRIMMALAQADIPREKLGDVMGDVMGAMGRIQHEQRAEGERFELDPKMREWLVGQGLDVRQIDTVVGLSRRIPAEPATRVEADTREDYKREAAEIEELVAAGRLSREDANTRLEEMRRVWAAEQGDDTVYDPGRAARAVMGRLVEAGLPREKMQQMLGAHDRTLIEFHEEGARFELDPEMRSYLEREGLSKEQIDALLGVVRGTWKERVDDIGGMHREEYEQIKADVAAGLRAGRMSRADHARVMSALDSAMQTGDRAIYGERRARGDDKAKSKDEKAEEKAAEKRLKEAVKAGEMTREEAERVLRERRAAGGGVR